MTEQTLATQQDTYNPFTTYGEKAAGNLDRTILKFTKGDWSYGADDTPLDLGHKLIANMAGLQVGWVRWSDNRPTDEEMVLVIDGTPSARRSDLGDHDQSLWELDNDGRPRDPWQFTNHLPVKDPDSGEEYVFATASKGGIGAIGRLAKTYGKEYRQRPGELPVIELGVDSYRHSNKSYGVIKTPVLELVGWVKEDDLLDGQEPAEEAAKPKTAKKKNSTVKTEF